MSIIANQPYNRAVAITKSDTINFDGSTYSATVGKAIPADAIYVGTKGATGTVVVVLENGVAIAFVGVLGGTILPIKAIRVNSATTDTSDMLALYYV